MKNCCFKAILSYFVYVIISDNLTYSRERKDAVKQMTKRTDIKKILIIGSGPIIIGQACEFDYSGTQACKALRGAGYEIVLVNSNPATIMTDPGMADHTYIEPLTAQRLEQIIAKEKPDALLPNLGGQTALNLSSELHEKGILAKYNVKVIGVDLDAIKRGEDRIEFKKTMAALGVPVPHSEPSYTVEEAEAIADKLGYPVVLRPAYTMGGTGGGIVYNVEELRQVMTRGLAASLIGQVLVEECVLGWEELELEVVRDAKGQKITVCFIENVDPMGVHTGDSFCVAPMLTVPKEVQERLQDYAYRIVDAVGVTGGTNVQFAHNREDNRIVVIEINPRTSRSSALASKATGFPIAHVSTLLATGMTLDEIPYWRKGTLEKYEPYGDYVVVKFARWAFEKFPQAKTTLGTQMKAVGEVMSIGKNFKEAFQKAIRSLEIGRSGLGQVKKFQALSLDELKARLVSPTNERFFLIYEAMLKGMSVEEIIRMTSITPYFIEQMREIADCEIELSKYAFPSLPDELLRKAKLFGFSDKYLAKLFNTTEKDVRERRKAMGMHAKFQELKVSGVENAAYYYSTYALEAQDDVPVSSHRKIMVLGGGPNRIGQGIEFDYTCVHAAFTLRDNDYESIMVNCNPETVSTDYDTSNKLYFEPLTVEDVLAIYDKEKPDGVIVQFAQFDHALTEIFTVFGKTDSLRLRADDVHAVVLELLREIQRSLSAELDDDAVAFFTLVDVENVFQRERLEIEFVAGVVVRGNRLRIAVDHDRFISGFAECEGRVDTAIVELDSLSDPVRTSAEDHDFLFAGLPDRFIVSSVGGIVIGSIGFKLSGAGVNEAVNRHQSEFFARLVDFDLVAVEQIRDLAVGIAELLDLAEQRQVFFQILQRLDRSDFIFK